jgi:outer membrane protein OmpA-like peptidoglycan-associated protein
MNKYPKLQIQLKSYTDCRGPRVYNQYLSDKRAETSVAYIQARINNPSRISGNGYGENSPVNGCVCEDDVKSTCSELAHQKNRRTAFFVIDK